MIQKERRGYYVLAEYTAQSAAAVAELERTLKLSDVVLRFVSIRQDRRCRHPSLRRDVDAARRAGDLRAPRAEDDDDEPRRRADAEASDVE